MKGKKPDIEKPDVELSDIEKSAIGEICDLITASLAKSLSERLGSDVGMDPSKVDVIAFSDIGNVLTAPILLIQLSSVSALQGQFFLYVSGDGLPRVFDLAIPDDAKEVGADDEVILEGLKEIVNTAASEAMTNFADSMGHTINCTVIDTIVLQDESGFESIGFLYPEGQLLNVVAMLTLLDSSVNTGYLLPLDLSNQIIDLLLNEQPVAESAVPVITNEEDVGAANLDNIDGEDLGIEELDSAPQIQVEEPPQVRDMQPAKFNSLSEGNPAITGNSNISLLLDVTLDASIELGKTQMSIEEILGLSKGSVIELDKLASEPVEFLVNGKTIARGEVVVIDDNFGIRITEILSPRARLESL